VACGRDTGSIAAASECGSDVVGARVFSTIVRRGASFWNRALDFSYIVLARSEKALGNASYGSKLVGGQRSSCAARQVTAPVYPVER
jgi:hypothetical protein